MTISRLTHAASPSLTEKLLNAAGTAVQHVAALWHAAQNRRSLSRLLEWDEHMLRDIGLTQSDVRSALSTSIADDPSLRLGAISGARRNPIRASAELRSAASRI